MADIVAYAWGKYLRALKQRPLATKAITSGVVAGCSDLFAQWLAGAKRPRLQRTAFMALYGLVYGGPSAHFIHRLMDALYANKQDAATVIKKVLTEQLTYGPVCNILMMIYVGLAVEGRSWAAVRSKVASDYAGVQLNGWKVWPLAAVINYKFVPIHLRVLFVNFVAFLWSTFLILRSKSSPKVVKMQ